MKNTTKKEEEIEWNSFTREEKLKRNSEYFKELELKDLKIIEENFKYGEKGGVGLVICKHCKKEYSWDEWGRKRSRALTLAGKHIAKEHKIGKYEWCSPLTLKSVFVEWTDRKSEALDIEAVKNAPDFKKGDKIIDFDGDKGEVIGLIKKGDKDDYQISKNHKIMVKVMREQEHYGKGVYIYNVTQIKLRGGK